MSSCSFERTNIDQHKQTTAGRWQLDAFVLVSLGCIVLCCIVLCCIVLYCIVLYCIVLYCIVLHCIVLCCVVLYCIVLYCIALHCVRLPECIFFNQSFICSRPTNVIMIIQQQSGGGSGICMTITEALMKHGAKAVIVSRNVDKLQKAVQALEQSTNSKVHDEDGMR